VATQTFSYNGSTGQDGSVQNFVVPDDVTLITIECWGAQGTDEISAGHGQGGLGGYIKGDVPVSPGETLQIRVGGAPPGGLGTPGGYNGGGYAGDASGSPGGGGGASDVRRSTYTLYDRLIIGAGGGGGSYAGVGTAGTGGSGGYPNGSPSTFGGASTKAQGGTQTAGGTAGTWGGPINAGTDGMFGEGGCGYRGTHCGVGGGTVATVEAEDLPLVTAVLLLPTPLELGLAMVKWSLLGRQTLPHLRSKISLSGKSRSLTAPTLTPLPICWPLFLGGPPSSLRGLLTMLVRVRSTSSEMIRSGMQTQGC
jgi:Glycine rich protein